MMLWQGCSPLPSATPTILAMRLSLLAGKPSTQGQSPAAGPHTAVAKGFRQASPELGPEPARSPVPKSVCGPEEAAREGGPGCLLTDLPDELDLDALVLQPLIGVLECEANLPGHRLSVVEEEIFLLLPVLRLVLGPLPTLCIVQQDFHLHALPEAEEAHFTAGPGQAGPVSVRTSPLCWGGALSEGRRAGRRTQLSARRWATARLPAPRGGSRARCSAVGASAPQLASPGRVRAVGGSEGLGPAMQLEGGSTQPGHAWPLPAHRVGCGAEQYREPARASGGATHGGASAASSGGEEGRGGGGRSLQLEGFGDATRMRSPLPP